MLAGQSALVAFVAAALPIIVHLHYRYSVYFDYEKNIYNHYPGHCTIVPGIDQGAVDMELIPEDNIAIFTSGLKKYDDLHWPKFTDRRGRVYVFNFTSPLNKPRELRIIGDIDIKRFNPHGLSVWKHPVTGEFTVFIINHVLSLGVHIKSDIEKFRFLPKEHSLVHLETVQRDNNFKHLTDLKATSESTFYTSIYEHWRKKPYQFMEHGQFGFLFKWGTILYFDGKNSSVVAGNYNRAYGIGMSPDNRFVYLAVKGTKEIKFYKRHEDNNLTLYEVVQLESTPNHISVDKTTGDIWVATHPVLYKYYKYIDDPAYPAPSQVLRLKVHEGKVQSIHDVFADDGAMLKGSTVAVKHGKSLLIGTQHQHLLYCDTRTPPL